MPAKVLFLNNKDMEELGCRDMNAVLHDVQRAYVLCEEGDVITPGKIVMHFGDKPEDESVLGRINCMPGYIGGEYDMAGVKWIGSGPMNYKQGLPRASVTIVLNDPDTKLPVCYADGTEVSAKRTGASGGTAIQLCAREDAKILTICGAGAQARTQLEAAMIVRPSIKKVNVYDIRQENALRFIEEQHAKYPELMFSAVETPEQAIRESDIIITVTLADEPFVKGEWLKKGSLLCHMAGYESDYACVEKADKIVVDFWETIKHRMGSTIALMWKDGLIKDADIDASLGEILCGKKTGRDNDDQIIYFNAVGAGILDLAVTTRCYRQAIKDGKGVDLTFWE